MKLGGAQRRAGVAYGGVEIGSLGRCLDCELAVQPRVEWCPGVGPLADLRDELVAERLCRGLPASGA